jgi:hypothetical protein
MASWVEIERVRKDPATVRRIAKDALARGPNEWEAEFLEARTSCRGELTTRQSEKLLEIRDDLVMMTEVGYGNYSVRILLDKCHMARLDLDEADEVWIVKVREKHPTMIRRRDAGRLMRCARQLNLITD